MKINRTASILVLLLFVSTIIISEGAHSQPLPDNTLFIDPPTIIDESNTPNSFTISVNISYVEGLHGWSVKLRYNPELLYTNSSLIREGPFLKTGGTTFWAPPLVEEDYVAMGSTISGPSWAGGTGTLANVTFRVKRRGETILKLFATELDDVEGYPIAHSSQDGYFRNIVSIQIPSARYTYFAQAYNVTFNASSSYSPEGAVQNYLWFWGGVSLDPVRNTSTTNSVTFHLYPETIPPQQENATVRLIVTDTNNVTSNILVTTIFFGTAVHELAVLSVEASPHSVLTGNHNTTIGVNITNNGNQIENTTLTLSYNSTYFDFQNITATQWTTLHTTPVDSLAGLENRKISYIWNTTGYVQGFYAIKAEASPVPQEANTTNNIQTGSMKIVLILHAPVPVFNFSPTSSYALQVVLFNASMSYDPDGIIVSYTWNFGDSNSTTVTESSTDHVYKKAGNFTVTLTVTDDDAISNSTNLPIVVKKRTTSTSISVSPEATTLDVGSIAVISGQVTNIGSPVNVTIFMRLSDQDAWSIIADVRTDQSGFFSLNWLLSTAGAHELKAQTNGDDAHEASTSDTLLVVTKYRSTITLSADRENASTGQTIILTGLIAPSASDATVTVEYKLGNESWNTLTNVNTNQTGWYTYNWRPDTVGTYTLRAKWTGNNQATGSESTTATVTVTQNPPDTTTYALLAAIIITAIALLIALAWKKHWFQRS